LVKYIVVIIIGIAMVLAFIALNHILTRDVTEETSASYKRTVEVETGAIVQPEMVKVTLGDSLYHKLECNWAGSSAKRMSLKNAIKKGFYPCPQCMGED